MLEFENISKSFGPVRALNNINFNVAKGEIVGLVGENGAGKSTLMKILFGSYLADSGSIRIDGKSIQFASPRDAMANGIGMVFQEQSLIPNLTVMENLFLGREAEFTHFGIIDKSRMAASARYQLAKVRLDVDPLTVTSELSFPQRQLVELAKVLTLEEETEGDLVILLDEPTSVLSEEEVELLFDIVNKLRSRAAFIFVSHRLDEVVTLSDRIYVLKDGSIVDEVTRETAEIPMIQSKMVGREIDTEYYKQDLKKPFDETTSVLSLKDISLVGLLHHVSFDVHAGEVVCLVGTEGSGREAILRTVFGILMPSSGTLQYNDHPAIKIKSPYDAVAHNIGYMPRERKVEGIFMSMSVAENMTSSQMQRYSYYGLLKKQAEKELAEAWIDRLSIKTQSSHTDCSRLSGGNQQKVVLAKWRSSGAKLMMLDHPTRGLDIGAKQDVYEMIRNMAADGLGLVVVPDTFEEAIGLAHKVIVMKDGRVSEEFDCDQQDVRPLDLIAAMT